MHFNPVTQLLLNYKRHLEKTVSMPCSSTNYKTSKKYCGTVHRTAHPASSAVYRRKRRRERHPRLQQLQIPQPALGHSAAGTGETLFLTYFRRRFGAINNQERQRNAVWAETSPATAAPGDHEPGARKESPAPRRRRPSPRPTSPPGRSGCGKAPRVFLPGCGGQTDTNKSPARRAHGPEDRPATEGCPPAPALREGMDTVLPLCPTTLHPLAANRHPTPALAAPATARAAGARSALGGEGGGRWEPAERRFLLPGAEGRRVPELPPRGLRRRLSRGRWQRPHPRLLRRAFRAAWLRLRGVSVRSRGGRCWQRSPAVRTRAPPAAPPGRAAARAPPAAPRGRLGAAPKGRETRGAGRPRPTRGLAAAAFPPRPASQRPHREAREACLLPPPLVLPSRCPLSWPGHGAARGEKAPRVLAGSGGAGRAVGHLPAVAGLED
ncbi:uncharacterized protein [Taeniopygia guttata]|uniref:uncharacterized protein n=1 Tax=Taeniopygia guttata TaxID=59729 RepID=UPI003BB88E91